MNVGLPGGGGYCISIAGCFAARPLMMADTMSPHIASDIRDLHDPLCGKPDMRISPFAYVARAAGVDPAGMTARPEDADHLREAAAAQRALAGRSFEQAVAARSRGDTPDEIAVFSRTARRHRRAGELYDQLAAHRHAAQALRSRAS